MSYEVYFDTEDVTFEPGPLVEDVFNADPEIGHKSGEFGDATRSISDGDGELD